MNANLNFNPEQFLNPEAMKSFMENNPVKPEAVAAFQKEAAEAAKALTECQTGYAREAMEDLSAFWRNWMNSGSNMQEKMELQTQTARDSFAKAMAHNKEVAAIVQKTQERIMNQFSAPVADKKAKTKN